MADTDFAFKQATRLHQVEDPAGTIPPATVSTAANHPLANTHCFWGVIFAGTQQQLQSSGIAVGVAFPGTPGANKKKLTVRDCNGFSEIEIRMATGVHSRSFDEVSGSRMYEALASYLPTENRDVREFSAVPTWPGVTFSRGNWSDDYKGTREALVAAGLAEPFQFPGEPGCGAGRTTFTPEGKRVSLGSIAAQEGSRTVLRVGKYFEVRIQVSNDERERRRAVWWDKLETAGAQRKLQIKQHLAQVTQSKPRPNLRLVWSA